MINGINENGIEIERKFVLKSLPEFEDICYKTEECQVYYREENGIWIRATKIKNSEQEDFIYIQTIKSFISKGTVNEKEKYLTEEEYFSHVKKSSKHISKIRYFCKHKSDVWEIDQFHNICLIMAELEVNDINEEKEIPDFIKNNLIEEVTGNENYFNLSLAKNFKYSETAVRFY
jgi:CYTH domain-containing protein